MDLFAAVLLTALMSCGLAWPLAARLQLAPAEKLVASVALSLLGFFLFAWALYVFSLPSVLLWCVPLLALAGGGWSRHALIATVRAPEARAVLVGQVIVTAWCLGWLASVHSYSGGGWMGDWLEHWQRVRFFLERAPLETRFVTGYPLPARPPLANVVTSAALALTRPDFAHFQVIGTFLASLAFLPAAVLAQRFRPGGRTVAVLVVLVMLNPSFVQNSTFPWTKLPAALFVLAGVVFFLRARDRDPPSAAAPLAVTCLAAGLLTHYSAAPYALLLAGAAALDPRARWREAAWQRRTAALGFLGIGLVSVWFGWSLRHYGTAVTFFSNSSATDQAAHGADQLGRIALNLRDTLVPAWLRNVDSTLLAQSSPWGYWRDTCFQFYQVNALGALGSAGGLVLLVSLHRRWPDADRPARRFWTLFALGALVLGVAVHGGRDAWGLFHICLQPLLLVGLAALAAGWDRLGPVWRRVLVAGLTIDFLLGLALHFGVQNLAFDRWLSPGRPPAHVIATYSETAGLAYRGKLWIGQPFVADLAPVSFALVLALLAAMLAAAFVRARRPT